MKENVAANEPNTYVVIGIFCTPLLITLVIFLLMAKLQIMVFNDEDAQVDKSKKMKEYSSLDSGFFNCESKSNEEDGRYEIDWTNFTNLPKDKANWHSTFMKMNKNDLKH